MRFEVITAPTIYTELTVATCVAHCRAYAVESEQSLFQIYINAAFALCEKYCGRKLNNGSYKITLDGYENIWLPNPKAKNVVVKTKLLGETSFTVLDEKYYSIDESGIESYLIFDSVNLPAVETKNSITIEYDSEVQSEVRAIVLQACLDIVAMMYESRNVNDKRSQTYLEWKLDHLRVNNLMIA